MKTVLFGLDGATYTVLDDLIARGIMPNLQALQRRGARAVLQSTPHPITPQAWTSMATGRSAGHHGVHDFLRLQSGPQGIFWRFNDSREIHTETIWKYASRHGKRVTVLNYFGVAPPQPINGHSMPGFVSGRHLRRSSYPADLFGRLQEVKGFDVKTLGMDVAVEREALKDMEPERWPEWIGHHIEREKVWFGIMEHLMINEPSDLTAIVFDGVDKIQHLAYRFLDPAITPKDPAPWEAEVIKLLHGYFRMIDGFLGRVVDLVGRWGRVFVASDHGFTATWEIFYVNKWLHDQGFLSWRSEVAVDDKNSNFGDMMQEVTNSIDLPNTRAFVWTPISNGIYLSVPPDEYHGFREELIRRLYLLKGPDGGQVVTDVKKREEWFPGPFMERVPDLVLTLRDFGFVSILNAREAVISRPEPAGTHHPDGILLGAGPGIPEGVTIGRLNILDTASLLVHSLGLEIPSEYEGTFPRAFYEPAYLESDPPRLTEIKESATGTAHEAVEANGDMDEEEQAIIFDRLKSLGYIE